LRADLEYTEEVEKSEVKFVLRNANMKDEHAQFSGSIPGAYDRYLGPIRFLYIRTRSVAAMPEDGRD
jgi:hypothetical protein